MADMGSAAASPSIIRWPMMTSLGQYGPVEMGGMFTVVKVREGLGKDDYKDPGWYKHPEGTVAHEWRGAALGQPERPAAPQRSSLGDGGDGNILVVRKPHHGGGHGHQ